MRTHVVKKLFDLYPCINIAAQSNEETVLRHTLDEAPDSRSDLQNQNIVDDGISHRSMLCRAHDGTTSRQGERPLVHVDTNDRCFDDGVNRRERRS